MDFYDENKTGVIDKWWEDNRAGVQGVHMGAYGSCGGEVKGRHAGRSAA